jgi:hypothetical protein
MRQVSQAQNMKVTDVATRIIESRGGDGGDALGWTSSA